MAVTCPECSCSKLYRDGLRYTSLGSVQRWLCLSCGHRFSEKKQSSYRLSDTLIASKDTLRKKSENLLLSRVARMTETELLREGELQSADAKRALLEFAFYMHREGLTDATMKTFTSLLKTLVLKGAELNDEESVKEALAKIKNSNSRYTAITAYNCFMQFKGKSWKPPKCAKQQKIPFIPTEQEVETLIAGCTRTISTLVLLITETGTRIGEALRLKWTDMNFQNSTVVLNEPEKNSNPRIFSNLSSRLLSMIQALPRKSERVFGKLNVTSKEYTFRCQRNRLSEKLGNPRLKNITFHTLRHLKGTLEYHRTKDIVHVQRLLGHKNIQNTMIYINLEQAVFSSSNSNNEFHVHGTRDPDEAAKLLESGFDYVYTTPDGLMFFRKRK